MSKKTKSIFKSISMKTKLEIDQAAQQAYENSEMDKGDINRAWGFKEGWDAAITFLTNGVHKRPIGSKVTIVNNIEDFQENANKTLTIEEYTTYNNSIAYKLKNTSGTFIEQDFI